MNDQPPLMAVPGSERYASRALPLDELRANIASAAPELRLHGVEDADVDALTYAVVRHRLWSITDEMGETLKKMSGSPGVTEANDFDFAICDEIGQEVQVGLYNTGLVASMDLAIYWILQNRSADGGIAEGDVFLSNDPWVGGGLHQNDTAIIAPLFWEGELFGWTAAVCHLIDIGGPKPGSANVAATDVFAEAPCTPPIRIVRGGVLQTEVTDAFTRGSRMPMLVQLDLRAKIAATQVGHDRLRVLIQRYGADTVKRVMKRMMDDAEGQLRDRLRSIPDGSWSAETFLEQAVPGDRSLHRIALTMSKSDDQLTFDFTGTEPQSGAINCPYSGMRAGVTFALMPILAGDIPWAAAGLMRCFDLVSEEGTINNATYPAAVGWAPLTGAWATSNLVAQCLGQMLDASPDLRQRVQSVCTGSYDLVTLAGIDQRGAPAVVVMFDVMAGGYGARTGGDGGDTAGILPIPMGRAPDVEMQELMAPLIYLWRREATDSGGAGRNRGGASISVAVVPWKTPMPLMSSFSANGKARPESSGLAGGLPGGAARDLVVRGSNALGLLRAGVVPTSLDELGGTVDVVANRAESIIGLDDVLIVHPSGGGGYGDPITREPASVAQDVARRKVSTGAAEFLYGVVVDAAGVVDDAATDARRHAIRVERLGGVEPTASAGAADPHLLALDDNLVVLDPAAPDQVACRHCSSPLGAVDQLRERLVSSEIDGRSLGIYFDATDYVDASISIVQRSCPTCAAAIITEVHTESAGAPV